MTLINVMKCFFAAVVCTILFSCKAEPLNEKVSDNLKNAMRAFLYNAINNDSSKVKYTVEEVAYYPEATSYNCEFTVRMKLKNLDTTGTMKANISKDMKTVRRTY